MVKKRLVLPKVAESLRKKGQRKDKILAHINPLEAMLLKNISGGDINPDTGLPQFGLFNRPKKWFKSVIGGAGGAILGNMLLPGIGGVIGGALGGAAGSAVRGRHDLGQAALRGAAMGAILPSAASLAGSGANTLGAKGVGSSLTNYGARNAILPSIGLAGSTTGANLGSSAGAYSNASTPSALSSMTQKGIVDTGASTAHKSFIESLTSNTSNYLSKPKNLLSLAAIAGSFAGRPKPPREKSPEQIADEQKRLNRALQLSPAEMAEKERHLLSEEHMRRRLKRNRFLPEERIADMDPIYSRVNTPKEYTAQGNWINYYNNPNFTGDPVRFKKGGEVLSSMIVEMIQPMHSCMQGVPNSINQPMMQKEAQQGMYFNGSTDGQDDEIPAMLSDGEFVIPADVVSHLGDGNNNSGAKKLSDMLKKVRHSKNAPNKLPPKAKSLSQYLVG